MSGYGDYVPVAKKKANAAKQIAKLRKKDAAVSPVVIEGRKIAKTWWGMAWCKNLESYADIKSRIGRGSAYVRNGFVVDLRIEEGCVRGQVLGSHLYSVCVDIDLLSKNREREITQRVGRRIESVSDLVQGKFPEELGELFLTQRQGLFPAPQEMRMRCSCPDWATMCKHVAAVLYGVAARLDEDPLLFFTLRGVDVGAFIRASIEERVEKLTQNAGATTQRVIEDADLSDLFGI